NAPTPSYNGATATFGSKLTTVTYNTTFKVIGDPEAQITATDKGIEIANTSQALLILTALTDYNPDNAACTGLYTDVSAEANERIEKAAQKGWQQLYDDHVKTFQSYMGRVKLTLGNASTNLPTNQLVDNYNSNKNVTGTEPDVLFLEQLYFAYGRYLEISSSLGIDVPNNLQGIWNNKSNAPWNSDIHSNINIQMNYWPAEPTNLSEAHMPFLNYIINMSSRPNWKKAATTYGKVNKGWTCFTENNIFGGMSTWGSNYFVANVWYCTHLWQHYRYTLDKDFLIKAFPAMYSAAQFWMERMIEDRGYSSLNISPDGTLVAPNEYSPEQDAHNSEDGTAHAQQLIYYNFKAVRQAIDILGGESGVTQQEIEQLDQYLARTDKGLHTEIYTANTSANSAWTNPRNGVKKGDLLLREWKYSPYSVSNDPGHRHLSHLMALYPLDQISSTSPYFTPAVNSLKLRGDAATGWSMGWKVNLWARALDGDHAHIILHNALKHSTDYGTNQYAGGVYYNLYDSHSPFQIDGNFGVCAGMAEMLFQSHTDTLHILPALPSVWKEGKVSGLKAVGDFEVSIEWKDQKPSIVTIKSNQGSPLTVTYPSIYDRLITIDDVEVDCPPQSYDIITIPLEAGKTATIDFNNQATSVKSATTLPANVIVTKRGATITVEGCEIQKIVAIDSLGQTLKTTTSPTFDVVPGASKVVILTITDKSGNIYTRKVKF
ncbi:MAG: glycosyl hydrolase family 95 catalytic domain-containing protein, partial [Bacteroidaceae bacterium]